MKIPRLVSSLSLSRGLNYNHKRQKFNQYSLKAMPQQGLPVCDRLNHHSLGVKPPKTAAIPNAATAKAPHLIGGFLSNQSVKLGIVKLPKSPSI